MKKQLLKFGCAILAIAAVTGAQAVQISGAINFSGSVSVNGNVNTATAVDFGAATVSAAVSGDYTGTSGTSVIFNDFTFAPFSSPVPNLWSFNFDGKLYTMTAETLTTLDRDPGNPLGSIELRGTGTANITGKDATPGVWIITLNTADNGATFSFSASSSATPERRVPEGGATLMLLGLGLAGMGFIRRKLS